MLRLQLLDDAEHVLRVVYAINREWEGGRKRLPQIVEPLALKPERLAERIQAALAEPDGAGALRLMRELARDALALAPELPVVLRAREQVAALLEQLL